MFLCLYYAPEIGRVHVDDRRLMEMFLKDSSIFFFFFFFFFLQLAFFLSDQVQASAYNTSFTFEGFDTDGFVPDGSATIKQGGLLKLTDDGQKCEGLAFYSTPVSFRSKPGRGGLVSSFSTTFALAIVPKYESIISFAVAFVVSPTNHLHPSSLPIFFGIFNSTNNGSASNHILAVVFNEIKNNSVGVHVNSAVPKVWGKAAYYEDGRFKSISFADDQRMQVWVDYDAKETELSVTMTPFSKKDLMGNRPFLSTKINLSDVILDTAYMGFSATTGNAPTSHFVLGWSFQLNGRAPPLDYSKLPIRHLPKTTTTEKTSVLKMLIPFFSSTVLLLIIVGAVMVVRRMIKFAEVLEDWEMEYGPHRFSYKDLYKATKGFKEKELLGVGGFGKVYKGVLPNSTTEIAVKKISHDSRQGIREFVAEIVSIGRLRHRDLVKLLGYCRRKGELLLVYNFMPNGSLDKFLFDKSKTMLNWNQRFHIIKGVASGLLYLHEGWEQLIVHRDVKSSNVLLDGDLNGRLGDFGLARLYDHGSNPHTTHIVGTLGYIAPELPRTGRATRATDVYAFGHFLLEVGCGRRPIEPHAPNGDIITKDWVLNNWTNGSLLSSVDPRLGRNYPTDEVELVLKLGLLCSHMVEEARPSMRQVAQFLAGEFPLPKLSVLEGDVSFTEKTKSLADFLRSNSSVVTSTSSMLLSTGR